MILERYTHYLVIHFIGKILPVFKLQKRAYLRVIDENQYKLKKNDVKNNSYNL